MKSKVRAKWVVRIPENADILVKEKSRVKKGDRLLISNLQEIKYIDLSSVFVKISKNQLDEISSKWAGMEISEGEILYETGGMFSKKILSPCGGVINGIDEFFNVRVDIKSEALMDVCSPVDARISKIEKEKIILSFEAVEYEGKGVVEGKVWGEGIVKIENLSELNSSLVNKFIAISQVTQAFIAKAEVMGIAGIITDENEDEFDNIIGISLPILALSEDKMENLVKTYSKGNIQVLMNSKVGRLLLVE